jgi:hypothetical protein
MVEKVKTTAAPVTEPIYNKVNPKFQQVNEALKPTIEKARTVSAAGLLKARAASAAGLEKAKLATNQGMEKMKPGLEKAKAASGQGIEKAKVGLVASWGRMRTKSTENWGKLSNGLKNRRASLSKKAEDSPPVADAVPVPAKVDLSGN